MHLTTTGVSGMRYCPNVVGYGFYWRGRLGRESYECLHNRTMEPTRVMENRGLWWYCISIALQM